MDTDETIVLNGMQPKDDEMKWNHKKKAKDRFLLFCETVLNHERELLSETLNSSSQESISENLAPDGQNNSSIENSTFNTDSDEANAEISKNFTNDNEDGVAGGDSFNSVTCFCGKPFAGRPMIECSSCLTWLHMSCVKVKRKNIPEFYYCDSCKNNGALLSPSSNVIGNSASSGEEATTITPVRKNGTISSNSSSSIISSDVILYGNSTYQNNQNNTTKSRKSKSNAAGTPPTTAMKKKASASLMMNSSDNIKNNSTSDSKYLNKKSSTVNGKLKKIRQTTKKMRPVISSTSLAAAASLTALSLNNQISPISQTMTLTANATSSLNNNMLNGNSVGGVNTMGSENINILKSPIATNNNNIYSSNDVIETQTLNENGAINNMDNGTVTNNKRLKLL
ncbi:hypothetical protein PVAND_003594 [Polypedilum vanderplanki]|uniref:Zinc finger PHD-type domain-containing protein n=1 Tax=Polypedilum vanderplanki TaxID=319348 RepID=A0A9J6BVJ3_POLVA|nr:hypothetical protein PVAND_003594 [Polypedilum vanderplanki]